MPAPDDALRQARASVLADGDDPRRAPLGAEALTHRTWWLEQWPEGAPHVLGLLAQDVQEAVHADDPLWPLCPQHQDHALFVEPDLGPDPFWCCLRTGLPVAAVGSLRP